MTRMNWEADRRNHLPKEYGIDGWAPMAPAAGEQAFSANRVPAEANTGHPQRMPAPSAEGLLAAIDTLLDLLEHAQQSKNSRGFANGILTSIRETMRVFKQHYGSRQMTQQLRQRSDRMNLWMTRNSSPDVLFRDAMSNLDSVAKPLSHSNYGPLNDLLRGMLGPSIALRNRGEFIAFVEKWNHCTPLTRGEALCKQLVQAIHARATYLFDSHRQNIRRKKEQREALAQAVTQDAADTPKTPKPAP